MSSTTTSPLTRTATYVKFERNGIESLSFSNCSRKVLSPSIANIEVRKSLTFACVHVELSLNNAFPVIFTRAENGAVTLALSSVSPSADPPKLYECIEHAILSKCSSLFSSNALPTTFAVTDITANNTLFACGGCLLRMLISIFPKLYATLAPVQRPVRQTIVMMTSIVTLWYVVTFMLA